MDIILIRISYQQVRSTDCYWQFWSCAAIQTNSCSQVQANARSIAALTTTGGVCWGPSGLSNGGKPVCFKYFMRESGGMIYESHCAHHWHCMQSQSFHCICMHLVAVPIMELVEPYSHASTNLSTFHLDSGCAGSQESKTFRDSKFWSVLLHHPASTDLLLIMMCARWLQWRSFDNWIASMCKY